VFNAITATISLTADKVAILGRDRFATAPVEAVTMAQDLSQLHGVALSVE
jgi:hypothetical protein